MDRLTQRIDGCDELDNIAFINSDDPEGLYNIKDIVEDFDDERLYKIADRLAAYEDTGLMPNEIPHWIPVSERLPKKWHNESGEPIEFNVMLPKAKEATTLCFNGSQWFEFDWKYMRITGYYSVTHWMPLPQPPKGEKS